MAAGATRRDNQGGKREEVHVERLAGLDAAFLSMETPSCHMHVMGVAIVDAASAGEPFTFERFAGHIEERLALLPAFRRRLVEVPLGINHPVWVADPDFAIEHHVRAVALPCPGARAQLARFAAEVAGRPLDRRRPLWEMYYVGGLEGGRVAIVSKIHHSVIDGVSGVDVMAHLFDLEPDPPVRLDVQLAPEWQPERVPGDAEVFVHAVTSLVRNPVRLARTMSRIGNNVARAVQRVRGGEIAPALPMTAPKLTMNGSITPHRLISFASVPLAEVKRIKDGLGVKLNDVVLAIATGALRDYLVQRGELPDRALVATIPTSVRTEHETSLGNHVSAMFAALPVHVADPAERVALISASTADAKDLHEEIGGSTLRDLVELMSPAMLAPAMRLVTSLRLADRMSGAIHNLVISNVPGPPFPLYMAGARLEAMHPLGPIFDGAALNLTVISYLDSIDFGFLACKELVPDLDTLAAFVPAALAELSALAGTPSGGRVAPTTSRPATVIELPVAPIDDPFDTAPGFAHVVDLVAADRIGVAGSADDSGEGQPPQSTPAVITRPRRPARSAAAGLDRIAPRTVE
jgi:diacylglycerol O-acyltransferase